MYVRSCWQTFRGLAAMHVPAVESLLVLNVSTFLGFDVGCWLGAHRHHRAASCFVEL